MPLSTMFQYFCLRKLGVQFKKRPRYISAKVWFDSADYKKIQVGDGVTISSNVRILTHDWALDTICDGIFPKMKRDKPIGRLKNVEIGDHTFIGTGSIIMPGAIIGKCCIVGAGCIVRGIVPDNSIVIGNPSIIIKKSTYDYLKCNLADR